MVHSITAYLRAGQLLHDRYRIVRLLGTGGMSVVYLANDERLVGKQWAIKESSPAAQDVRQLVHEASIMSALRHLHLPFIIDFYSPDASGRAYLVMEYIEGHTIADLLQMQPMTFKKAMRVVVQVCEVLAYLHRQSPPVVFRDVKPSNIMISKAGQVKLIDFGIARNVHLSAAQDTVKLGTVGFAAPEQYRDQQTDARTDLYGVGALVGYMLTGGAWSGDRPLTASMLAPDVPVGMHVILTKLLEKRPEDRYQSVEELIEQLRPFRNESLHLQAAAGMETGNIPYKSKACVVIAFLGAASGLGTTHSALMCASTLAKGQGRTIYLDANPKNTSLIQILAQQYEREEDVALAEGKAFTLFGVDYIEWKFEASPLPSLLGAYDYIVLDLGCGDNRERMDEFARAHIPLLVSSIAPWREADSACLIKEFAQRNFNRWLLAVPNSNRVLAGSLAKVIGGRVASLIPHQSDPFECSADTACWVEGLVGSLNYMGLFQRMRRWVNGKSGKKGARKISNDRTWTNNNTPTR